MPKQKFKIYLNIGTDVDFMLSEGVFVRGKSK
jgi:hypothetical protein